MTTAVDVRSTADRFSEALGRGDLVGIADCYTGDAVLLPPGLPAVVGRERISAFWRSGIESGLRSVVLEPLDAHVDGETAVEVGRATLRLEPEDGPAVTDVGKYVVVARRQPDGCWRRAVDIFNSDSRRD